MIDVHWRPRLSESLRPQAAVAFGDAALRLCEQLLPKSDNSEQAGTGARAAQSAVAQTGTLYACVKPALIMLQADERDLPWLDGIHYATRVHAQLWVPTHLQACMVAGGGYDPIDIELLANACANSGGETLLWPDPALRLRLDAPMPATATNVQRIHAHLFGATASLPERLFGATATLPKRLQG
jgi:hypothetical protein